METTKSRDDVVQSRAAGQLHRKSGRRAYTQLSTAVPRWSANRHIHMYLHVYPRLPSCLLGRTRGSFRTFRECFDDPNSGVRSWSWTRPETCKQFQKSTSMSLEFNSRDVQIFFRPRLILNRNKLGRIVSHCVWSVFLLSISVYLLHCVKVVIYIFMSNSHHPTRQNFRVMSRGAVWIESATASRNLHCESKKTRHLTLAHNFAKYLPIFKILSVLDSVGNL